MLSVNILKKDPRYLQIFILFGMFIYGLLVLGFENKALESTCIFSVAILSQFFFTHYFKLPFFEIKSSLITALSLCLLLKSSSILFLGLAAFIAIASKFLIRNKNGHFFNPTNFAIALMIFLSPHCWISPGQWGNAAFFVFFLSSLGLAVVYRSERSDVTFSFIFFYVALFGGRALWLGDPIAIPLNGFKSGALILFAFFMISDPKTTPNSRSGRILFALVTCLFAYYFRFFLYDPKGLMYSLVCASLFTPIINRVLPGKAFNWRQCNEVKNTVLNPLPKPSHS